MTVLTGYVTAFAARVRVSRRGFADAAPRALRSAPYLALVLLAMWATVVSVFWAAQNGVFGFDFRGTLWEPGIAIRDGVSPYPDATIAEVEVGNPALYPPLVMLLVVPLTFLAEDSARVVWMLMLASSVSLALILLRVRDPRCHALVLLSAPVVTGLIWGNVTLLLVLGVAAAWHWRGHWRVVGVCVGIVIAAKLFLWPLALWLLGTRRYRAFGLAAASCLVALLLPWALIGLDGLRDYPELLAVAEEVYAIHSYSIATALSALGASTDAAVRLTLAVGIAVAGLAFVAGRRGLDEVSLAIAVGAAILGSPIVWEHYYALLIVSVAIVRPQLSWLWGTFILFYFTHGLPRPRLDAAELLPGGTACCKPPDVPAASWVFNHAPPGLWPALANAALVVAITAASIAPSIRRRGSPLTRETV